jgi:FkbM family methyltransferase
MSEHISTKAHFRPNTNDEQVWHHVVDVNEYRIPERINGWTVLDVGAHIGSFVHLCVERGAAQVIALEPHPANYRALMGNIEGLDNGRVMPMQLAAWRSDQPIQWLPMINPWQPDPGAGGGLDAGGTSLMREGVGTSTVNVLAVPFNEILRGMAQVDLMKIDCEAAEFPILLTCTELHRIKRIAGEYHEILVKLDHARVNGIQHYTRELIYRQLTDVGFKVEFPSIGPMGLFFATR